MAKPMEQIGWKELEIGNVIVEPSSSKEYRTGDWRTGLRPVVDTSRCTRCTFCYIFCPEGAVERTEEGYFLPNMTYCKGCGICAHECPVHCIDMKEEDQ